MITEKEFLLLSLLSYYNFSSDVYGMKLYDAFKLIPPHEYSWTKFKTLSKPNLDLFLNFFYEELNSWEIFLVNNNRATNDNCKGKKTGFFGISYKKDDKYVLAFRGSEIYPYEEAYKDFIETNLIISLGRKPEQFNDATLFLEKHLSEFNIKNENISLTGHSLGGGIAMYTALHCHKTFDFIPKTVTWNGVGLKNFQIFSIDDFFNFNEFIDTLQISSNLKKILLSLKNDFFNFLQSTALSLQIEVVDHTKFMDIFNIYSNSGFKLDMNIRLALGKVNFSISEINTLKMQYLDIIENFSPFRNSLETALWFFKGIIKNDIYKDYIYNYGHSNDVTFNLYGHIGNLIDVNNKFNHSRKKDIVSLIPVKKNIFLDFHFDDVFIPYFKTKSGVSLFSKELNLDYIAAGIRFFLYKEKGFSKEILKRFYSFEKATPNGFFIRNELILGLKSTSFDNIYKDEIEDFLLNMNDETSVKIWNMAKLRLSSPYEYIDIFDVFFY